MGGYFIVNGNERLIRMLILPRRNYVCQLNVTILVCITKHSSALYIGMAKVLPIIDVLGYDGQNSSFSSSSLYSDLTSITQKGSHIST